MSLLHSKGHEQPCAFHCAHFVAVSTLVFSTMVTCAWCITARSGAATYLLASFSNSCRPVKSRICSLLIIIVHSQQSPTSADFSKNYVKLVILLDLLNCDQATCLSAHDDHTNFLSHWYQTREIPMPLACRQNHGAAQTTNRFRRFDNACNPPIKHH